MSLIEKSLSPAKVNLILKVLGKRPDGYHEIRTLMQPVSLYDVLTVEVADGGGIEIKCASPEGGNPPDEGNPLVVPSGPDNLAYKAAELFLRKIRASKKVRIEIVKNIPVGAGLGGGSSNAAAVLMTLNSMTGAGLGEGDLMDLSAAIGSDVPFFILKSPAMAAGRGTDLARMSLPKYHYVLVNPGFHVSTAWAYSNLDLTKVSQDYNLSYSVGALGRLDNPGGMSGLLTNDLEAATIAAYPAIARLKRFLMDCGADASLMSGSGPTVFGVFRGLDAAQKAFESLRGLCNEGMRLFLAQGL